MAYGAMLTFPRKGTPAIDVKYFWPSKPRLILEIISAKCYFLKCCAHMRFTALSSLLC